MADYIYLLETRLTRAQQKAIATIRSVAREHEYTIFLTGGAVRDMTGGGSIRDLDLTVQGEATALRSALEATGAEVYGEDTAARKLFLQLAGGVRVELSSAVSVSYPKPGQPQYTPATLTEDLRSRDFTANAMAVSLNEGSYGLLMDPLNGVADIENRELRLVSNYGFIEDPSRLLRAARLSARLGWQLEERTRQRYDTAKEEGYISALSQQNRGYELEEIFHEEDPVRVLRALEAEGWLPALSTTLSAAKANTAALNEVAERQGQLQTQGLFAQSASLTFPLVTAKMTPAEVGELKQAFVRPGFVREIEELDSKTREFATQLGGKEAAAPSAAWRILHAAEPNLVLALSYTSKSAALQGRLKTFLNDSPTARQRIPYAAMQEMRITPDLPGYDDLIERLVFELMDNKLSTTEEVKAFLEPFSPPAPPPPINLRRARAKKEARPSRAKKKAVPDALPAAAAEEEAEGVALGLMEPGTLTGADRGPEPTPRVPLVGKVSPKPAGKTSPLGDGTRDLPVVVAPKPAAPKPARSEKTAEGAKPATNVPPPSNPDGAKPMPRKHAVEVSDSRPASSPAGKAATAITAAKNQPPASPGKTSAVKLGAAPEAGSAPDKTRDKASHVPAKEVPAAKGKVTSKSIPAEPTPVINKGKGVAVGKVVVAAEAAKGGTKAAPSAAKPASKAPPVETPKVAPGKPAAVKAAATKTAAKKAPAKAVPAKAARR